MEDRLICIMSRLSHCSGELEGMAQTGSRFFMSRETQQRLLAEIRSVAAQIDDCVLSMQYRDEAYDKQPIPQDIE